MDGQNALDTVTELTIDNLLEFLDTVKTQLVKDGRPDDYDVFLDVLRDYTYKE